MVDSEIQSSNAELEPDYRRKTKRLAIGAGLVAAGSLATIGWLLYSITQSSETMETAGPIPEPVMPHPIEKLTY